MLKRLLFQAALPCSNVFKSRSQLQCLERRACHHITQANVPAVMDLEQAHIEEAIKLEPTLSTYTPEVWHRAHQTFQNHGLETLSFLRIVTGNPKVLRSTPQHIIASLEVWRACQFGERLLHMLLTKYPELLDMDDAHKLLSHTTYLKSRVATNKNVWKLLMNSPDLLAQSERTMEEKFNYIENVMRIEVPELVKSAAMSLPFEEMRSRHVFLVRLGLFTPRAPKADPNEPTSNNRLYQITDTSEKTFATKICHVTLPEYEAFKELFARELDRRQQKDKSEDHFSDDEDAH